ncbi:MAG: hypothetical protein U0871_27835 [Gemmataceae bacterium]
MSKRLVLIVLVALTAAVAGCGWRKSSCRDSYAPPAACANDCP